ncbi:ComF family protein [Eikenella sp. S3360]|uniref:ComF family protein n=1 Tax=Eikenella glucosivorans TaxID=2766967 RepID=A0ABS0NAZ2_9NEIS|nr:ComF family protein [Eikenella glucosivorans]MBH5329435.1 ComF family protein [Eikenella glucosivorans]
MALSTWLSGQWRHFGETFQVASSRGKRCVLCHESSGSQALCAACTADLHALRLDARRRCPLCAGVSASGLPCGRCQQKAPPQAMLRAAFRYAPPLSNLIYAYKFLGRNDLYAALAELLLADVPAWPSPPDVVMAVPLSVPRLHQRGFNQSLILAEAVAKSLNLPLLSPFAVKRSHRVPQSTLPRHQRAQNVRGIFQVASNADVKKRHVLLIDDVVTSGATIGELARSLRRAGASAVYGWVLARPE